MHTKVLAVLTNVMQMVILSITLEEKLKKSTLRVAKNAT